jgi:hypothetical protein
MRPLFILEEEQHPLAYTASHGSKQWNFLQPCFMCKDLGQDRLSSY